MPDDVESDDADGPDEIWAVPRLLRVLRWVACVGLVVVIGYAVRTLIVAGPADPTAGAGIVALVVLARMLRVVVVVYLDPASDTLTLFRTVGPALRTRPGHVRRLDRGLLVASFGAAATSTDRMRPPGVRVVADEGTATLSMLVGTDVEADLAQALLDHNPDHLRVEL